MSENFEVFRQFNVKKIEFFSRQIALHMVKNDQI